MGIGYYTLHSSCGTYLPIGQDTRYPLEGISLYKCYSGCAFQFLQVLHCTAVTHWAKARGSLLSPEPFGARGSSSLAVPPSAQVKRTYEICLHLAVMVVGPAAVSIRRKLRLRPVVNGVSGDKAAASL